MKKISYLFAIVTACGAVGVIGLPACTVTTTDSNTDGGTSGGGKDASSTSDTGSTTPDSGSSTSDAGGTCNASPMYGTACDTCLNAKCTTSFCACFGGTVDGGSAECRALDKCIDGCLEVDAGGASACIQACADAHAASAANYKATQECGEANCATECQ